MFVSLLLRFLFYHLLVLNITFLPTPVLVVNAPHDYPTTTMTKPVAAHHNVDAAVDNDAADYNDSADYDRPRS